ncbi:hypothetical protein PAXRUDRAFT_825329 [Paxillus rubicundulus Ve08.2h10]|uniref:Uncharacterized protein n=1 Tax=Paxillus rubicundulus Ve08.2h10 TaxID=930991 RepID=A0A0D0DGH7_9AGAM|nr:hypothetical protein PAXRUDRAFT_825329 [Paxillus rubicundulus Ve08.2h10]
MKIDSLRAQDFSPKNKIIVHPGSIAIQARYRHRFLNQDLVVLHHACHSKYYYDSPRPVARVIETGSTQTHSDC